MILLSNYGFCVILSLKDVINLERILVIGAGPAGITSAIHAKTDDNEVVIMEKNLKCGKKLLLTGNGHCNYWNEDESIIHFHSDSTNILNEIITIDNIKGAKKFIKKIGIIPLVKNGYYYPFSNQSFTMLHALITECNYKNIKIYLDSEVKMIKPLNKGFEVLYNDVVEYITQMDCVSASLLQRKFRLGYNRPARMIDLLEEKGIVGPQNGSKPREVLINKEPTIEPPKEEIITPPKQSNKLIRIIEIVLILIFILYIISTIK